MDYTELALELIEKTRLLRNISSHKNINEALRGEIFVLHYIARHGSDVQPGEISAEMGVSSARIATALNSLERKGLITREIDRSDRRRILVQLTQEGKELTEKQQQAIVDETVIMLEALGEHDAREYVRIIGKIAEIPPNCKVGL